MTSKFEGNNVACCQVNFNLNDCSDYVFNKQINLHDVNNYKGRPLLFIEDGGGYIKTITGCNVERGVVYGIHTIMFSSAFNFYSTYPTARETLLHVNCDEMVIRTLTETEFELYRRLTVKSRWGFPYDDGIKR